MSTSVAKTNLITSSQPIIKTVFLWEQTIVQRKLAHFLTKKDTSRVSMLIIYVGSLHLHEDIQIS